LESSTARTSRMNMRFFLLFWITTTNAVEPKRTVMAWGGEKVAALAARQLRNETWAGIFDGVQGFCGARFNQSDGSLSLNHTEFGGCSDLIQATRDTNTEFHLVIGRKVPQATLDDPGPLIGAAIDLCRTHGFRGVSLDDESDGAPRDTYDRFVSWVEFVDRFADDLHGAGLMLSAAIQQPCRIRDAPHSGHRPEGPDFSCSLAEKVGGLLSSSHIDRWLEMDTYYFTTGRMLESFGWYVRYVAAGKLGVGLSVHKPHNMTSDGMTARFYAIDRSPVDWVNMYNLPVSDIFLAPLRRWKTRCAGCRVCFDYEIDCDSNAPGEITEEQQIASVA